MVFYSWDDIAISEGIFDLGKQMAGAAKNFACSLWEKYPKQFVGNNPYGNFQRQFWNNLCFPPPKTPIIPSPPLFQGGQCPVKYNVSISIGVFPSTTSCSRSPDSISNFSASVWGEIADVFLAAPLGNCGGFSQLFIRCHGNSFSSRTVELTNFLLSSQSYGRFFKILTVTVTRQDGQPDNCGSINTDYPNTPPPLPGNETYNVTFEGDDNNNFTFPLVWNNIDFSIPLKFDFEVGKIEVNFDGIDLNFDNDNEWKVFPPLREDKKKDRNFYIPRKDLEEEQSPTEEEIEEEVTDDSSIKYVLVEITKTPAKGRYKTILQNNPSDSTFFAGYFSWQYEDHRFPEEPIRKKLNVFHNSVGADGFRLYTVNDARVKYTILREKDITE